MPSWRRVSALVVLLSVLAAFAGLGSRALRPRPARDATVVATGVASHLVAIRSGQGRAERPRSGDHERPLASLAARSATPSVGIAASRRASPALSLLEAPPRGRAASPHARGPPPSA